MADAIIYKSQQITLSTNHSKSNQWNFAACACSWLCSTLLYASCDFCGLRSPAATPAPAAAPSRLRRPTRCCHSARPPLPARLLRCSREGRAAATAAPRPLAAAVTAPCCATAGPRPFRAASPCGCTHAASAPREATPLLPVHAAPQLPALRDFSRSPLATLRAAHGSRSRRFPPRRRRSLRHDLRPARHTAGPCAAAASAPAGLRVPDAGGLALAARALRALASRARGTQKLDRWGTGWIDGWEPDWFGLGVRLVRCRFLFYT